MREEADLARARQVVPGARRAQDSAWLRRLEREGVHGFLEGAEAHPLLYRGLEEFNRGAYWQAHETWEEAWRETPYPLRLFYHGLIKVAVAFHHLERGSLRGARHQAVWAERLLAPFAPACLGVRFLPALEALRVRMAGGSAPPPRLLLDLQAREGGEG